MLYSLPINQEKNIFSLKKGTSLSYLLILFMKKEGEKEKKSGTLTGALDCRYRWAHHYPFCLGTTSLQQTMWVRGGTTADPRQRLWTF